MEEHQRPNRLIVAQPHVIDSGSSTSTAFQQCIRAVLETLPWQWTAVLWDATQLHNMLITIPPLSLRYYPEFLPDGLVRQQTIVTVRQRYDQEFAKLHSKIQFVGMSVYKEEASASVDMDQIYIPLRVVPEGAVEAVRDRVAELLQSYPANTVVVTSRIVGYDKEVRYDSLGFSHHLMARLNLEDIADFVTNWYNARLENTAERQRHSNDLIRIVNDPESRAIRELEVDNIKSIHLNRHLSLPAMMETRKLQVEAEEILISTWGIEQIKALSVWGAYGARGKGIIIGLLDTGVDASHPDLKDKVVHWAEFDSLGNNIGGSVPHDTDEHGTHCAGTIVGANASGRFIGVAPEAHLAAALVLNGDQGGRMRRCWPGLIEPWKPVWM